VISRRLSLSFDNGPTPGITERVLDVLARHGLRVTFFVVGQKLRNNAAGRRRRSSGHDNRWNCC
jgi:peptidoglycan/xylan/chitin deacetylase (PgdA/CDA1 family)